MIWAVMKLGGLVPLKLSHGNTVLMAFVIMGPSAGGTPCSPDQMQTFLELSLYFKCYVNFKLYTYL